MRNTTGFLALAAAAVVLSGCVDREDLTRPGTCLAPRVVIPTLNGDTLRTASGVKYLDAKVGTGATAGPASQVTVAYVGYLTDGTMFTQSNLAVLYLPDVIPGFREGVAGMKAGGVRRVIIPSAQGYGTAGSGTCVPPGATLIFDINLMETVF